MDFRLTGATPRQGIELQDNSTMWTDGQEAHVLRLMFPSYSQLCEQPLIRGCNCGLNGAYLLRVCVGP